MMILKLLKNKTTITKFNMHNKVLYLDDAQLQLCGTCEMTLLFGHITILGYEWKQFNIPSAIPETLPIYAYPNYGALHIDVHDSEEEEIDRESLIQLLVSDPNTKPLVKQVPHDLENVNAIVLVQNMDMNLQIKKKKVEHPNNTLALIGSTMSRDLSSYFTFENIIDGLDIVTEILKPNDYILHLTSAVDHSRYMICGIQGSGKSVLCRYTINALLQHHPFVYLLDLDVSGPEYGITGQMSLIKVYKPLLGPSFTNHYNNNSNIIVASHVYGSDTPETNLDDYISLAMSLYSMVKQHQPLVISTVNTSCWGGYHALSLLSEKMQIDQIIRLGDSKWGDVDHSRNYTIKLSEPRIDHKLNYSHFMSYFTCKNKIKSSSIIDAFHHVPTYKILWERLRIVLLDHDHIDVHHIMYYLNNSIVGLGISSDHGTGNNKIQIVKKRPKQFQFIGFAIIVSICPYDRLYHLMTPITVDDRINTLIPTSIPIPIDRQYPPYITANEIITKNVGANMDDKSTALRDKQRKHRQSKRREEFDDEY
jgi:hypothetical protein